MTTGIEILFLRKYHRRVRNWEAFFELYDPR